MKSEKLSNRHFFLDLKSIITVFVSAFSLCVFFFFDQSAFSFEINSVIADVVIILLFIIAGSLGYLLYKNNLLNTRNLILLLFLCGFALRLGYALRYGYQYNQHDVESLDSKGHLSYIYYIAENLCLPNSNDWQYSHPPLHHIISAVFVKFCTAIGYSLNRSFENIQLLTVFYSSLLMPIGLMICKQCKIKGKTLLLCAVLLSFHPTFFILSGSINNDVLTIMLSMSGFLYLLKWYNSPSVKSAVLCGFFIGLAMMTKVSAALIAVVVAVTVIIKFIISNELRFKSLAVQTLLFLAVMLPLGLWHPIRNYILFAQPIGYVAPISVTSQLYIGGLSLFERIGFSLGNIHSLYVDVWNEHNLWLYLLRNSLFGEYSFGKQGIALFLVVSNFVLIICSIIALVYLTVKIKVNETVIPIIILFIVQLAFFVYFNIKYPFGCSMDFRYIVPLLFTGIVSLAKAKENLKQNSTIISNLLVFAAKMSTVVFIGSSIALFV